MTFNYDAGRPRRTGKAPDIQPEQPPKAKRKHIGKEPDAISPKPKTDKPLKPSIFGDKANEVKSQGATTFFEDPEIELANEIKKQEERDKYEEDYPG